VLDLLAILADEGEIVSLPLPGTLKSVARY
jgi:hypothetical protein